MTPEEKRVYDREWWAGRSPDARAHKQRLQNERRWALRKTVDAYKVEHPCACGETDVRCLDFHHADDNKEVNVADCVSNGWAVSRIMTEIAKCTVVCANCHRKLHHIFS